MIHRRTGVFWTSASSRYGIIAARDQCGWEGDARTTGHQKRSPAVKKHACSATCQAAESQLERRRHVPEPGRERHREHAEERIPEPLGRRGHEPAHVRKPPIVLDELLTGHLPAASPPPERWMNGSPPPERWMNGMPPGDRRPCHELARRTFLFRTKDVCPNRSQRSQAACGSGSSASLTQPHARTVVTACARRLCWSYAFRGRH